MTEVPHSGATIEQPWVIVWMANQDDARRVPQMYTRGHEGRCPFETALELAHRWAPAMQVMPVVLRSHKPWWFQPVESLPVENLAEQPFNRGTAPGILLALLRIYQKDSDARVILLSARGAERGTDRLDDALLRTGTNADIVVFGTGDGSAAAIDAHSGSWPTALGAADSDRDVIVAKVGALLQLFVDTQPELTDQFLALTGPALFDESALDRLYPFLPETDFESDVLRRATAVGSVPADAALGQAIGPKRADKGGRDSRATRSLGPAVGAPARSV